MSLNYSRFRGTYCISLLTHDDVIKWKHFKRTWPFVRGIHRWPVNSPQKGQWRGALMFSLISFWINSWINNGEAGDLKRHRAHYDVTVISEIECYPLRTWQKKRFRNCLWTVNFWTHCALSTPSQWFRPRQRLGCNSRLSWLIDGLSYL